MSREGQDHAEVWSGATRSSTLVYDTIRRRAMDSRSECHSTAEVGLRMIRAVGELDCFSAHIRLREPDKSEDKAEGGTSVESSIPCSHGGRALVVKEAEEVENAKANSKYQDRTEGQRPRNFIRSVSMDFSSR
ncbi:hypothetical protein BHM03_00051002 [Ensete ventricosum]|nr:hypothetical protein BHM03_00051002 [Ensete ventricosum]